MCLGSTKMCLGSGWVGQNGLGSGQISGRVLTRPIPKTWGCADGPAMDDRNLCRPYNFRQKPKYANDPFNSKTVTKLTRYSE